MGQERSVVTETMRQFKRKTGWPCLTAKFDYSELEIGDWFVVRGRGLFGRTRRSMKMNAASIMMDFRYEEIEPLTWKVTRIA